MLGVLLGAEALILVIFAVVVLAQGGAEGIERFGSFTARAPCSIPACWRSSALASPRSWASNRRPSTGEEARNPERTIPRATYISVAFMAIFYGFIIWAVIISLGETNAVAAGRREPRRARSSPRQATTSAPGPSSRCTC